MQYITFTELRTNSKRLAQALSEGLSVNLIHRSRLIGRIDPVQEPKPFDPDMFEKFLDSIKPKKLVPKKDRDRIYRKHLEEKYGEGLS